MKEIAIFGDSLVCDTYDLKHIRPEFPGWSRMLKLEYKDELTNYAAVGAGTDYAFDKFLENHHNYKKIIFNISAPRKMWFPITVLDKLTNQPVVLEHWWQTGGFYDRIVAEYNNVEEYKDILQAIDIWAIKMSLIQQKMLVNTQTAIISYMKNLRPDIILLPGSYPIDNYTWTLWNISGHELRKITPYPFSSQHAELYGEFVDTRPNHFSIETNKWILEHVKGRLNDQFIDWDKESTIQYSNINELYSIYGKR